MHNCVPFAVQVIRIYDTLTSSLARATRQDDITPNKTTDTYTLYAASRVLGISDFACLQCGPNASAHARALDGGVVPSTCTRRQRLCKARQIAYCCWIAGSTLNTQIYALHFNYETVCLHDVCQCARTCIRSVYTRHEWKSHINAHTVKC